MHEAMPKHIPMKLAKKNVKHTSTALRPYDQDLITLWRKEICKT